MVRKVHVASPRLSYSKWETLPLRRLALVRITPTQVSCSSPGAPAKIYAQGSASLPKTPFYRAFYVSGTPSLFSTQDRAGHASKRRVLAHPFSYASVRDFEGWMRISLGKFVRDLDRFCVPNRRGGPGEGAETPGRASGWQGGQWVDILLWLNYMAFDVISDLAFGEPLGMLDKQSDVLPAESASAQDEHGVADMIDFRGRTAAFLGLFPTILPPSPLANFVLWLLRDIVPDPFISRGLNSTESLSKIAQRCVKDRLRAGEAGTRGDLLDRLVEGLRKEEKADGPVKEEDIVTEAMLLLTAGSDTTANSTAAILFHVLKNPRVYDALRKELNELVVNGELEEGEDGLALPCHDQVKNLKYLQATIEEGLRMFATNAFGLPRVVPEGGAVELDGWTFVEGTELSAPAYSIQHDPTIWGDPKTFRPERWLEGKDIKRYLLTFGMGPRACIGKNLAYMQMQLVLATLVLRYDFELRDETLESVEGFMHKPVDLWVRIQRRTT